MICVMAAGGEVGKGTVAALLGQGVDPGSIVAAARSPASLNQSNLQGLTVRSADYRDEASMASAFRGVRTLVLIPTKTPPAPRCIEHANALAAAKAAGVERVVFLSIQSATPESRFEVAPFILFAECAVRQCGLRWTMPRMSLYVDPIAEWAPELARTGRLPYPVKDARIAYVSRRDVSRALAAIATNDSLDGKIPELTGPTALSMPEVAEAVSEVTGKSVLFHTVGENEYRDLCRRDKLPEEMTNILVTMYRAAEAQEFARATDDIRILTGKAPESVREAIARLLTR